MLCAYKIHNYHIDFLILPSPDISSQRYFSDVFFPSLSSPCVDLSDVMITVELTIAYFTSVLAQTAATDGRTVHNNNDNNIVRNITLNIVYGFWMRRYGFVLEVCNGYSTNTSIIEFTIENTVFG